MAPNGPWLVAAFYRFAPLQNLDNLRAELQQLGGDQGLLGTVLLAAEGVNGTVCGSVEAVSALLDRLRLRVLVKLWPNHKIRYIYFLNYSPKLT